MMFAETEQLTFWTFLTVDMDGVWYNDPVRFGQE
jgi:hypothetical protein